MPNKKPITLNKKHSSMETNETKPKPDHEEEEPRQHVPYILNGELYRIESQNGDNVTVKCCYCPPDRIYRGSVRSTGNFHMHIKRRHASLLGKLHEMKVAALVERRDRIMKNRNFGKSRKKISTTTSPCMPVSAPAAAATEMTTKIENQQLKIKTVFQRHKQEHEQEEAAMRSSTSACDSLLEMESDSQPTTANKDDTNNNNNIKHLLQNVHNLPNLNPTIVGALASNQSGGVSMPITFNPTMPMVTMPRLLTCNLIKPEQQTSSPAEPEPEAIDLSTGSSLPSDEGQRGANCLEDIDIQMARSRELAHYVGGPPRDILLRIDNRMGEIKQELQRRNQIEQKRLLLEAAKFKFINPSFNFESLH